MALQSSDHLTKKLLYQSNHRGCKETDVLLGNFANNFLYQMTNSELEDYAMILEQTDSDIVDWIMGKAEVPNNMHSAVMTKLLEFSQGT